MGELFALEGEALGGDLFLQFGHVEFVVEFAEVELDFVGVHFGFSLRFRFSTLFFGAGDLQAFGADGGGLFADFDAGWEVGEALEGEELVRGVVLLGDEGVGGGHDGVVHFFGGAFLAGVDFVVGGEGEFFAGSKLCVDFIEAVNAGMQHLEGFDGDVEIEAAFGTGFVDLLADVLVGARTDHVRELVVLVRGERGERGLRAGFAVCFHSVGSWLKKVKKG